MRLFIGIKTGCECYLNSLQDELKKTGKGNFTDVSNLHITLRFLGEVPPSRFREICDAVSETGGPSFILECGGIQVFSRNRIVSVRVGGETDKLAALYTRLETALGRIGFEKEPREYSPHITLAKNFRTAEYGDVELIPYRIEKFKVTEIILFESRQEAGSLVYSPRFIQKLEDAGPADAEHVGTKHVDANSPDAEKPAQGST